MLIKAWTESSIVGQYFAETWHFYIKFVVMNSILNDMKRVLTKAIHEFELIKLKYTVQKTP
jgi:hypothetical protein